jgi:hypothetical protein
VTSYFLINRHFVFFNTQLLVKIDCWRDDDCAGYKNAFEIAAKQNNFRLTDAGRGQVST